MDFFIALLLIFFGAPLVGIAGRVIEGSGHEAIGKTISIGGYLAVLGFAAWLVIGSL